MSDVKTTGKRRGERSLAPSQFPWKTPEGKVYRCKVIVFPNDDDIWSVYAATLPGVASQGKTEEEALDNITEALTGALAVYKEQGQDVPWTEGTQQALPRGAQIRSVIVHG